MNLKDRFNKLNPDTAVWLMLGLWWVINLLQAAFTGLADDEAYYHIFSRHLAWGYYDHPPLTALLVRMGSFIGGELGVRFFFTLIQPLYLYILWVIIRPKEYTVKDVGRFVLISAALPILQLYGFIAVPDGPLMLCTALFLLTYKRFTETNGWVYALLMGLAIGILAYSKYQGALVVVFAVLSNLKLFKNPKFYTACLTALMVILPHLWWQYQHDWVSFSYHLVGRNTSFKFSYVTEFILNVLAVFNPFLFPVAVAVWWKTKASSAVDRAMSAVMAGFILFFFASTLRGHVQPQWYIVSSFYIITLLYRYSGTMPKLSRYVTRIGWITVALIALVRIEMIFNPIGLKYQIFDNKESYNQIAEVAQGRPVIFDGKYTSAAKYDFYAGGPGFAQPTLDYRTSQYGLMDMDSQWIGQEVVVQVGPEASAEDEIKLANGKTFAYVIEDDFRPSRLIEVEHYAIPEQVKKGESMKLRVELNNPYPYPFRFGESVPEDGVEATMQAVWYKNKKNFTVEPAKFTELLPAESTIGGMIEFTVPDLPEGEYTFGFTIVGIQAGKTWFNSKPQKVKIVE